jgi:glycosyltransferase involved in cell wall biosynthesis
MSDIPKTLFIGWQSSVVSYYRCFLPAIGLGADYVARDGEPPNLRFMTGLGDPPPSIHTVKDYEVVVLQQPRGVGFLRYIRALQGMGLTVLYEIDDYVQGARRDKRHELTDVYNQDVVRSLEMCMRVCDGMIVTTPFLARRYRAFNDHIWVCPNGIDVKRYEMPKPPRSEYVTIGWAGGVGHATSLSRWDSAIRSVMRKRPNTRFISVGYTYAAELMEEFGPERAIPYGATMMEVYPATMSLFDIAIAPSAENNLFRGKSDLRWLEASSMHLPLVAHPDVYPEIEDGVTGLHARSLEEVEAALLRLIDNEEERVRIGEQAYQHVYEHRRVEVAAQAWRTALQEVAADRAAAV